MSSSGTLRRATPDEVFAGLLIEREIVEPELVDDIRAALMDESGGGNIIEALIDSEVLPLETAELIVDELERGILTCPGCPGRFNVASLARGARFKCKTCGEAVTVPAIPITREVLGRFGWADGGDIDIDIAMPSAAPAIELPQADVTSDADAIEAAMAVGTAEGQLLDFTDVDVDEEMDDAPLPKPPPKPRSKRARAPRSSRRAPARGGDGDDDFDPDDDDYALEDAGPKPKPALMMWMGWVVIPIVMCAVVMYYTAEIKTWMFGAPDNDDGGYYEGSGGSARYDDGTGDYKPSIKAEECDDWEKTAAAAEAAMALLTAARNAVSAGDTATALEKFAEADEKFSEAYEAWDEVVFSYGKHCDHLRAKVDAWVKADEAAEAEAAKLK